MKMMNALFFVLYFVTIITSHTVDCFHNMSKEDLKLETELNLINKSPIKSIHTKSGYIVDCVDITKQPAFDHPLLHNHKLQRTPSFERKFTKTSAKILPTEPIYGLEKVSCPKGSVPIRRMTKDDLIRGKYLFNDHILTQTSSRSNYAHVFLLPSSGPYYGVSGTTSIWNPVVAKGQESAGHVFVQSGKGDDTSKIIVGWHVLPQLYNNDNATHFYSYWRSGISKNGCYNILCSGFVQTSQTFYIGSRIRFTSVYRGDMVEMPLSLVQDPTSKNWWLSVKDQRIGYFPARLFSNMTKADKVGWGGLTVTPAGTTSPAMGSGVYPDGDFKRSCYFRNVAYQTVSRKFVGPAKELTSTFNNCPNCYNVRYYGDLGRDVRYSLQFGGPGCNCGN